MLRPRSAVIRRIAPPPGRMAAGTGGGSGVLELLVRMPAGADRRDAGAVHIRIIGRAAGQAAAAYAARAGLPRPRRPSNHEEREIS